MRVRLGRWVALAVGALMLVAPVPAEGAGPSYVALGDSYTSSPLTGAAGAGVPGACLQSTNNYPNLVAAAIQAASFDDVSCSGAVIANLTEAQSNVLGLGANPPQLDALTPTTTLVTIGIGANDAKVFGVASQCLALDLLQPLGSACRDSYSAGGVDQVGKLIDETAPKLAAAYQAVHARAPQARVLAVGYPAVVPVDGTSCWPLLSLSPADVAYVASLLVHLNQMIATTAAAHDVQYVDTYTPTIGHDVCQAFGRAGFTGLLPTSGLSLLMHPDALGEQLMAGAVLETIDHPPPPPPSPPASAHLRLTHTAIARTSVSAAGMISSAYRGHVAIAFETRYRRHAVEFHRTAIVTHGRFHAQLQLARRYRGLVRAGTFIARSHAEKDLAAGTARARVRSVLKVRSVRQR